MVIFLRYVTRYSLVGAYEKFRKKEAIWTGFIWLRTETKGGLS
jgi:hypothetical protein